LRILREVTQRADDLLIENKRLGLLVSAVRREQDILAMEITDPNKNNLIVNNPQLMQMFKTNKRLVTAVAILQEFLKETGSTLLAKELTVDIVNAYEQAMEEDTKLECAMSAYARMIE
jgi:hypothetical protein